MNDSSDSDSHDEPFRKSYKPSDSSQDTEGSSENENNKSSDDEENENSLDEEENENSTDEEEDENSPDEEEDENSPDDEENENSPDDEEITTSSDDDEITASSDNDEIITSSDDDDDDNVYISKWNYHIPKRNLKLFDDDSNIIHGNYFNFRPIDAFKLLFTEQLFELTWKQTNIYGQQRYGTNWIPVNLNEIKSWIGLNILMGYHKLPSYKLYWSSNSDFRVPIVCKTMSRNLFTKILTNIHLIDNQKMPSRTSTDYSKTYKVDKFLDILQKNFKENYVLGEHVSINGSMIKFKGRSSMKQYLPKKPTKRGFKVWTMADSTNGYVYSFRIYTGKDANRTTSLGEHVVKDMVQQIEFSYRKVYFDNYFTTPGLLDYLYKKGIYAVGTVRIGRKNMPKDFCHSTKEMNRGDFEYITSGNVVLHKWMDKKLVFALSNFHDPTSYDIVQRKEKSGGKSGVKCPTSIIDYNKYMGGVDLADQRKASYGLDRKSRRWWLRIFFNFMNVALSNAFIIFNHRTNSDLPYLNFLSSIATGLIEEGAIKKKTLPSTNPTSKNNRSSGRKISVDLPKKMGPHLPIVGPRGRCALCSTNKAVHRSIYHCSHCNRAFCMNSKRNCFYDYHKKIS